MTDITFLEKVADAIDAARFAHPQNPRERPRPFADADPSDREYAIRLARAALMACREPNLHMLQAGYPAMIRANKEQVYGEAIIDAAWKAMIANALGHR